MWRALGVIQARRFNHRGHRETQRQEAEEDFLGWERSIFGDSSKDLDRVEIRNRHFTPLFQGPGTIEREEKEGLRPHTGFTPAQMTRPKSRPPR
jgi:hypothetical protein